MASPSPRHRLICQRIMQQMPKGSRLEVLRDPAFVETNARLDLKRFSRYWSAVKYDVLRGKK
jgi:TusA-related sulfurtransferase